MAAEFIEEIKPHLYRAIVPLPRNPLKAVNSYIIKGEKRNLVIDTGMNREECRKVLSEAFALIDLDLERTDFFGTHLHADHIGLIEEMSAQGAKLYFNQPDAEMLQYRDLWSLARVMAARNGFPPTMVDMAIDSHPGQRYSPASLLDFTFVEDGDLLEYGPYQLQCLVTPGHTRGHTCLYEPHHKLFFSGDHILGDITPNITAWRDDDNPLSDYFDSLDTVYAMDIELVLPGHRSLFADYRGRIDELKEHHFQRLLEVLAILRECGPANAFKVAAGMTWDLDAEHWDDFPLMQKWFATGEALAHIQYLEAEGELEKKIIDGVLTFNISL